MADSYYSSPSDFVAGFDRQLKQRKLGGQTYDPRTTVDVARGVYGAAVSRMLDRKKAADAKEASDKALALQERGLTNTKEYQAGVLSNAANALAADKEYKGGALNINTEANRIKAIEAANADKYRMASVDAQDEARKDQSDASMANAALNLGGKLFSGLFGYENKDPKTGQISRGNKAVDWFKGTVMGGANPGSDTGYTTGEEASYFGPGETGEAFAMPASAPQQASQTPAIGTDVSEGPMSTGDMLAKAYGESVSSAKPETSTRLADASLGGQTMTDAGGSLPAIGEPMTDKGPSSGTPKYEDTDSQSLMAAEGHKGGMGAGGAGEEGAELDPWNYEAPEWKDPDPFTAPQYEAPTLPGYQAPEVSPFSFQPYQTPPNPNANGDAYNTYKYAQSQGYDGTWAKWEGSDTDYWNQHFQDAERAKYDTAYNAALGDYNNWAQGQQATAQQQYNQWAARENATSRAAYDREVAEAQAGYDKYWTGERAKYDTALHEYEQAKEAYEGQSVGGGSGEAQGKAKWDYNQGGGIGGRPTDEYYGNDFSRETSKAPPREFETGGYRAPGETAGGYRGPEFNPTGYAAPEQSAYLGGREYEAPRGESFSYDATPNYEPPSYESPYNYSQQYNPSSYEPRGYEAPNYEAGDYGGGGNYGYEPPNYEAGSYGGGGGDYYDNEPANYEPGGGGGGADSGKIVCTELNRRGYLPDNILASDSECRQKTVPFDTYVGYLTLFSPVVALMRRSTLFANIVRPFGIATAHEMASRVDAGVKGNILGKALLKIGLPLCRIIGKVALGAVTTAVQHTEV